MSPYPSPALRAGTCSTLTSGIISSMANITPPIGVLKVAAMPAPAPAATRMIRCPERHPHYLAEGRPESRADLDDRTFASDRGTAADRDRGGQGFYHGNDRPDHAPFVVNCIHDLRHTVALRFGSKVGNQKVTPTPPITGTRITSAPHGDGGVNRLES